MRILHVVHGFPPECRGGTETYLPRLAHEIEKRGHAVAVIAGSHRGWDRAGLECTDFEGITVWKLHRSGLFNDAWERSYAPEIEGALGEVLAKFRPDLAHVHHWIRLSRHLVGFFHDHGVPAVVTLHDLWTTCPRVFRVREDGFCGRPVGAAACSACVPPPGEGDDAEIAAGLELFRDDLAEEMRIAAAVVAPAVSHREELRRHLPDLADRIRVVPFGAVDTAPIRTQPHPESARLRVGHWGNLSFLKGLDVLLEAAAALEPHHRDRVEFHLFGNVVFPEEQRRAEVLATRSRTTFHGVYALADLAAAPLDLAVFPSRCSESYGYVLDEAFRLGLPALVPARGALGERLGGAGATFIPESAADLTRLLGEVIDDRSRLDSWRAAIPKLVPFAIHADGMISVYRKVLASGEALRRTSPELRRRRAEHLALQVEARNRRLDTLRGEVENLRADVARQNATLAEMDRACRNKDDVIADLRRRFGDPP